MDLAILQTVAKELDEILPGSFVHKIHQPLPREIVLRTRRPGGPERKLAISADPAMGRIHLTDLRIPNPPVPPRFCAFLRAHFQGSRVLQVTSDRDDRVVRIIATRGREPERQETELVLELLGRDSNIILIDRGTNTIMECLHHIPEKEIGLRAVLPGREYLPPPRRDRVQTTLPPIPTSPGISIGADGKRRLTLDAIGITEERFPSMNLAADAFYSPTMQSILVEALRRDLSTPLRAQLRSLDRRIAKIEGDAQRLKELAGQRVDGELLKGNLRLVKKGMTRLTVPEWESGQNRTILLDPTLGPVENMGKIFKKAAKGRRGEEKVRDRLIRTLEEMQVVQDLLYFLEAAESPESLEALAEDIRATTARRGKAGGSKASQASKKGLEPYRLIQTPQGRQILAGKSARGNDFILRHKARKGDLWFHVKDFAGAHVLLPVRSKESVPAEELEFAASMAVHFSKARGKGKVEVIVADVGDLGRPSHALPGQVTVRQYSTMLSEGVAPNRAVPEIA